MLDTLVRAHAVSLLPHVLLTNKRVCPPQAALRRKKRGRSAAVTRDGGDDPIVLE